MRSFIALFLALFAAVATNAYLVGHPAPQTCARASAISASAVSFNAPELKQPAKFFDMGLDNEAIKTDTNMMPARKCASCFG